LDALYPHKAASRTVARLALLTPSAGGGDDAWPVADTKPLAAVLREQDARVLAVVEEARGGGRPASAQVATPAAVPRPPAKRPRSAADAGGAGGPSAPAGKRARPEAPRPPPPPPPSAGPPPAAPASAPPPPFGLLPLAAYESPADRRASVRAALVAALNAGRAAAGEKPAAHPAFTAPPPPWWPAGMAWNRKWHDSPARVATLHGVLAGLGGAAAPAPGPARGATTPSKPPRARSSAAGAGSEPSASASASPSGTPRGGGGSRAASAPPPELAAKAPAAKSAASSDSASSSGGSSSSSSGASSGGSDASASPSPSPSPSPPPPPAFPVGPNALNDMLVRASGQGVLRGGEGGTGTGTPTPAPASRLPFGLLPLPDYPSPAAAKAGVRAALAVAVNADRAAGGLPPVTPKTLFSAAPAPPWWPADTMWGRSWWASTRRGVEVAWRAVAARPQVGPASATATATAAGL